MSEARCRNCGCLLSHCFLDLGELPLVNAFLRQEDLEKPEFFFPLKVWVCEECFLVQIFPDPDPEKIFRNYPYYSSYSSSWLEHIGSYAKSVIKRFALGKSASVVEVASNDGYLLKFFKEKGFSVQGIEPARNLAEVAQAKGIPTLAEFFSAKLAQELRDKGTQADLLIGNNVLAHVPKLNDFVHGLKILLSPKGIISMEFPHLLRLIEGNQFDTIHHEHYSYFSLKTAEKIFASHGLKIFDLEEIPTHGGSLRIYATHLESQEWQESQSKESLKEKETQFGLEDLQVYKQFSQRVFQLRSDLKEFIQGIRERGLSLAAYGAPGKGNVLINFCRLGPKDVSFTVEKNPHKVGLFLPGSHIPVFSPEVIYEKKPDYLLILPWNLKEEIMGQMAYIREWGGKFLVPVPKVEVLS